MVRAKTRISWARLPGFVVFLAAAVAFLGPGFAKAGGFPAPLDDTYIYFGFARATALGSPLAWVPGNGFSSGATSLLYPLLLAPFWALGLRGAWLGLGAALIAVGALVDLDGRIAEVLGSNRNVRTVRRLVPLALVAVPLLDWSLFSGMETALFAALLGRALAASGRALTAEPHERARAQTHAGLWCAALPLARPEGALVAGCLGLAVVHGARSLKTSGSLLRAMLPLPCVLAAQALLNRALTGEWQAAGAIRKLLTEQPHATGADLTLEFAKNLVVLLHQAFFRAFGGQPGAIALILLAFCAVFLPGKRRLAVALVVGSSGSLLLVCLNATARFQNYRYAAPSQLMLLLAAILGASALTSRIAKLSPRAGMFAALPLLGLMAAPLREWPKQIDHFARASRNIATQQGEVARRLALLDPRPRRVLVGDAGAIPYLSELPALDGLGLGGYHRLPFARASLHGDAAVVELIERMPPEERPDWMALYPGWWGELPTRFGTRVDSVRIDDNVICAADEKVIYQSNFADLSTSGDDSESDLIEVTDLADLVSEREHEVAFPRDTGEVIQATRALDDGRRRWDGGRRIAAERTLTFRARPNREGSVQLRVRTDAQPSEVTTTNVRVTSTEGSSSTVQLTAEACVDAAHWCALTATFTLRQGDWIALTPAHGELRAFALALVAQRK